MNSSARVRKHRAKCGPGMRRVEVIVPMTAADEVRAAAKALRQGGRAADAIRRAVNLDIERPNENAREFFERIMVHIPPGEPLVFERDQTTEMREINLK